MNKTWALHRALQRLRDVYPDMTISQAQAFLLVGWSPGVLQRQLYDELGQTDSAMSRNIALLSDIGSRYKDGLDLIRLEVDPDDRRARRLYLTRKGERLLNQIQEDAYGSV